MGASNDSQLPSEQTQTGVFVNRESSMPAAVATTLLQLHLRVAIPAIHHGDTSSREDRLQFDQSRLSGLCGERPSYSRSWSTPYNNSTASVSDSVSIPHYPYTYPQAKHSTITGLTSEISNLQQEQLTMRTRQANIAGTLEQVLYALQELKDNGRTTLQNQGRTDNSSSSKPQISIWEDVSLRLTVSSTNRPPQEFTSNVSIGGAIGALHTHSAYHTDQENQAHAHDEAL